MSWTPTFLIEKESFDKNYPKISGLIDKYRSREQEYNRKEKEIINEKTNILYKNAIELGYSPDENELRKKAEELMKKEISKLWEDFDRAGQSLATILEYIPNEDYFFEINGNKYYIVKAEFSSDAQELKDFLDKNKIPYSIGE